MKRLAIFTDGTWNDPADNTNVYDLSQLVVTSNTGGVDQRRYYHSGVGVSWGTKLRGGALGYGLSGNVLDAYRWLVENYDHADEIYLFGFSRGAYTARSIAGVIVKCGLIRRDSPGALTPDRIYERYRLGKEAIGLYDLTANRLPPGYELTPDDRELLGHSHRVPIKFIGVWDTVGALGIPWTAAPLIGRGNYYFHDTNLSTLIQNAYHAMAIDENRGPYAPTLWTKFLPDDAHTTLPTTGSISGPGGPVEQRWFIGAHCNVGGGYKNDLLKVIPCAWLQSKAAALGLAFNSVVRANGTEYRTEPIDSYSKFLLGTWKLITVGRRFYRDIGYGPRQVNGGWSVPINEWIDKTVFQRWRDFPEYRPPSLAAWAKRAGIDPAASGGDRPA